jgi:TPR repeat protein
VSPTDTGNASSPRAGEAGAETKKELATAGGELPSNVPDSSIPVADRPESVLERQGAAQKPEPTWSETDSVDSLWGAVQGGSISAEVSLAERFARGLGVNKNCDQAKVLMKAAADRGNREARLRLYEMETGGCR